MMSANTVQNNNKITKKYFLLTVRREEYTRQRRTVPSEEATHAIGDGGHDIKEQLPVVPHHAQVVPLLELRGYEHLIRSPTVQGQVR